MATFRKVAVAMSGGVDSSVAAALLKEQGWDVVGVTFHLFDCRREPLAGANTCCSRKDVLDATRVAARLDIPHEVVDFSAAFREHVMDPFVAEYRRGRTPNPCIRCNQFIKFRTFWEWARDHGCEAIATGHHAQVVVDNGRHLLQPGRDRRKDQTYFLFALGADVLPHVLFPVGTYEKAQVRAHAARLDLPVAEKSESQEICFVAGGSYAEFLEDEAGVSAPPGEIVDLDGLVLGRHEGLHRYTIGQRKGIGLGARQPLYVVARDGSSNRLVVGPREALACRIVEACEPVWLGPAPASGARCQVRVRYRSQPISAVVSVVADDRFTVVLDEPAYGVAPGQAAVLYDGRTVLGGGWIEAAQSETP